MGEPQIQSTSHICCIPLKFLLFYLCCIIPESGRAGTRSRDVVLTSKTCEPGRGIEPRQALELSCSPSRGKWKSTPGFNPPVGQECRLPCHLSAILDHHTHKRGSQMFCSSIRCRPEETWLYNHIGTSPWYCIFYWTDEYLSFLYKIKKYASWTLFVRAYVFWLTLCETMLICCRIWALPSTSVDQVSAVRGSTSQEPITHQTCCQTLGMIFSLPSKKEEGGKKA